MYYKLGQACVTNWGSFVLLQIRANVVTNWGSFIITNWGKCCYKLGQLLQIRATVITKQGSYYKLGQNLLQIGVGITNQGNYYKFGHNIMINLLSKNQESIYSVFHKKKSCQILILSQYLYILKKQDFQCAKIFFVSISVSPNVKISLPIFITDNSFPFFIMFHFFGTNWYFGLSLQLHFC